jgi:hypothetical protein
MRGPIRPTRLQGAAAMLIGMAAAVYYAWQNGWLLG